jgi:ribosomal protein S18 acetylase RimI-like enzyme
LLQLLLLHVGRAYRQHGLGARLFRHAQERARLWSAAGLYVSATPTENTIRFYLGMGCRVILQPDPQLLAAEPEDIHLAHGRRRFLEPGLALRQPPVEKSRPMLDRSA